MSEKDIESRFRKWLPGEIAENFRRLSWESILKFISANPGIGGKKEQIVRYFENKTVGYRMKGNYWQIQKAFAI